MALLMYNYSAIRSRKVAMPMVKPTVIAAALLVIGLALLATGVYMYAQTDDSSTNANPDKQADNRQSEASSVKNQNYLVIEEWGIKVPDPDQMLTYRIDDNQFLRLSTKELDEHTGACDQRAIAIVQANGTDRVISEGYTPSGIDSTPTWAEDHAKDKAYDEDNTWWRIPTLMIDEKYYGSVIDAAYLCSNYEPGEYSSELEKAETIKAAKLFQSAIGA